MGPLSYVVNRIKTRYLIYPQLIYLFIISSFSGFVLANVFPTTGRTYFNLYASDVALFALGLRNTLGLTGAALSIILKNLIPVSVLTFFPYILVANYEKLGLKIRGGGLFESLESSLKLISLIPIFAYGFVVYGLFIGHIYLSYSMAMALKLLLSSMIHGLIEILVILAAGTTALIYVDVIKLRREEFKNIIKFGEVFNRWLWLVAGVAIAALIETLVFPLLFLNNM